MAVFVMLAAFTAALMSPSTNTEPLMAEFKTGGGGRVKSICGILLASMEEMITGVTTEGVTNLV